MFGSYKTLNELGRGGMAVVFLAEHQLLHNQVAIKVLNNEFVRNEHIRSRFLAEARNMARMSHPNIIKVNDLIDEGDNVAFVMEYIEGETLKDYLERKGKLSEKEIKNIFTQMLDAVGYVHEQKLVHRDIKPSNFMITPNGKVKLMDFGIAKNTDSSSAEYTQTGTGVQMGTPMYMSPEQVTETKSVTAQSDIYSLGVLLWQMVSGRKPYDMATLSAFHLQSKIVNEPLENTGTEWDSLIRKATAKEITLRYTSAEEFKKGINSNNKTVKDHEATFVENNVKKQVKSENNYERNDTLTEPVIPSTKPSSTDISDKPIKKIKPAKILVYVMALALISGLIIKYISNSKASDEEGESYIQLMNDQLNAGDTMLAMQTMMKGRNNHPKNKKLLIEEINMYLRNGESEKAEPLLSIAIENDPNNHLLYYASGTVFESLGRSEQAIAAYKKTMDLKPDFWEAYYNLGAIYINEAKILQDNANSEKDNLKYEEGKMLAEAKYKLALPNLEKALELAPENSPEFKPILKTLKSIYSIFNMTDKYNEVKMRFEQ